MVVLLQNYHCMKKHEKRFTADEEKAFVRRRVRLGIRNGSLACLTYTSSRKNIFL